MTSIKKIAIANRGEVACRIHRTCEKMGIQSLLLHSEPDVHTLAYRICNETVCIGPAEASQSYLNIEKQIQAALDYGADAIHPGFGFLSESSDFARKVEEAGLIFIGPSPKSIESFGDKKLAKELCKKAGVPSIPGYQGSDADIDALLAECEKIGYPVIVKAAAGGGGRGMRILRDSKSAPEEIEQAKNEALKAFGNGSVFLEKYLDASKHIEVQIFGDCEGKIHILGERECSVQRKHQKIIEECPSTSLSLEQKEQVHDYAKKIATSAQYKNAGTVEFLFQNDQFYFLEVNTRLQVEHPVTEEVYGVDLVEAQILTASEQSLSWPKTFKPQGHSIELRLYAEDPYKNGAPSIGKVGRIFFPEGSGRRYEYGIERDDLVSPFYDSMMAKIISYQNTRRLCLKDLNDLLSKLKIFGVHTNKPLLASLVKHPDFVKNTVTTQFFEKTYGEALSPKISAKQKEKYEEALRKILDIKTPLQEVRSPWAQSWQNTLKTPQAEVFFKMIQGLDFEQIENKVWWTYQGDDFNFKLESQNAQKTLVGDGAIISPMPGTLFKVFCTEGDKVKEGDTLVILEAMKMEHSIKAPKDGKIKYLKFKQGDTVQADDVLLEMD